MLGTNITKLSATKLESFVSCPYKYYLKYVRRAEKFAPATTHMIFGVTIHKILEDFVRYVVTAKLPGDPGALQMDLRQQLERIFTLKFRDLLSRNPKLLQHLHVSLEFVFENYVLSFFEWFMENKLFERHIEPERNFEVTIREIAQTLPQEQLHKSWEKYVHIIVNGKIDLTVYPDIVVDYKTQPYPPHIKRLLGSFQTNLYTLIEDKDMVFIYMYVKRPLRLRTMKILRDSRLAKFNEIIEVLDILTGSSGFLKNPKSCDRCIFKKMCHS